MQIKKTIKFVRFFLSIFIQFHSLQFEKKNWVFIAFFFGYCRYIQNEDELFYAHSENANFYSFIELTFVTTYLIMIS